ncbi:hypothetical protein SNE40_011285 [Patella caerulea]|uniref:J domain-containing protein n=1 Tax=Patella caerulea TaxID=87958 RepID=A0AAN8JNY6_PATCE
MAEGLDEGRYGGTLPQHGHHSSTTGSSQPGSEIPRASESWTPFSGMPSSPVSPTGLFSWESFNSSAPNSFDNGQIPHYYSNYPNFGLPNIHHSASDNSGFNINDDNSTCRPTNVNSPIQRPIFNQFREEGYEMYAEAIKQLQQEAPGASYGHFATTSPTDLLTQSTCVPEPPIDTKDSIKPTYSDIAKSLKSKPMQKGKDDLEIYLPKSKSPTEPSSKTQKSHIKRSANITRSHLTQGRTTTNDGNFGSVVSPDSKYGLDHFEEVDSGSRSDRSSILGGSNESLSYRSRQGSTSSLSSGTSGIEEIHLTKTFSNPTVTLKEAEVKLPDFKDDTNHKAEVKEKSTTSSKEKSEKFFDPRRIFQSQSKDTYKKKLDSKVNEKLKCPDTNTVLNNGKPTTINKPPSVAHKKADYINNDLRDPRKRTNQNTASSQDSDKKSSGDCYIQNGTSDKLKGHGNQRRDAQNIRPKKSTPNFDWEAIDEYVNNVAEKIKNGVKYVFSLLFTLLLYILGVLMYIVFWCVHIIGVVGVKVWNWCSCKFFSNKFSYNQKPAETIKRKIGLEENIDLPSTGEEAMKRLLSCKGKDPYSILGLRADASDEDVKKYYRKQAVLVHPDKNQELGAEESFKILGHAFEMIGEPTKRLQFDAKTKEETDAESAMREFADLLTKLQEKIQEAANLMRCDNCGGKHKRIPINRPWYSARFCDKCNINHSAKEGDVWAETSMLGFLWHYYAIMDGNVYDITEWVACHKDFFKHMQANAHPILYRIATDGNRNHRSQGQSREAELEDFISQLFNKANMTEGAGGAGTPWQQHKSQSAPSSQWNPNSGGGKKSRKKKKRH